jgi:hypothetical protein
MCPPAGDFPADGGPLQDPQQQQQQGGDDAEHGVGGQQADQQGRQGHQDDAEGEHPLEADEIAKVGHDDAPQGAGQVAGGEDAEGLELAQPLGNVGREEELADDHGEEDEDDEVVEFEGAAQRRQAQGLVILSIEGATVVVRCADFTHILMFPIVFLVILPGGSYEFFKGISVYARIDNLLNQDYQYYWGYPTEGINFTGGVSFKF